MKMQICWSVAALAASAIAIASSDTLAVKSGLWEITYTTQTHGMLVPQSTLDKMTPEQRAKVVASMNAQAAKGPRTHTRKTCVTAEDMKEGAFRPEGNERDNCKYTWTTRTSSVQEQTVDCTGEDARHGSFKVEAQGTDHMNATFTNSVSGGGVDVHMTGKWLDAACPADTH